MEVENEAIEKRGEILRQAQDDSHPAPTFSLMMEVENEAIEKRGGDPSTRSG